MAEFADMKHFVNFVLDIKYYGNEKTYFIGIGVCVSVCGRSGKKGDRKRDVR